MRRLALVAVGCVVLVGGFVLWLQVGLVYSLVSAALGGYGLQSHLTSAADGVQSGEYPQALEAYEAAVESSERLEQSVSTAQIDLLSSLPVADVAIANWRYASSAAGNITEATGGLLSLYADLSGESGGAEIFSNGAINLDLLEQVPDRANTAAAELAEAHENLEAISVEGPAAGALARIRGRALEEMAPVEEALDTLVVIAPTLPDALGANGVRRYLVGIGNQAEMRAAGGAPLTLVMVEFDEGRISIPIKGQTSTQLFPPLNAAVKWYGPAANPFFPTNPRNAPFVVTNTHPNMLFSAQEMAGAWTGGNYPPVDGVITLDLTAIAAVLDATGPLESETYGSVDGARLGQLLLVDAYQDFGQEDAVQRQQANQQLVDDLLTRLLGGDDLVAAAQAVASTAPGRHVQFWMRNSALESLAQKAGAAGVVVDPDTGDWSAMYTQNGNQSKVDVFQQRNVLVTVQLTADGGARVTQRMTLTNATPADRPEGPPERVGYETMWLKNAYIMYVPDSAVEFSASYPSDYAVRAFKNHPQLGNGWADDGFGHRFIRIVGWTPPGGQTSLSVSYTLPSGTFLKEDGTMQYLLQAEPQSLWNPSVLTVQVTGPEGWDPIGMPGMETKGSVATVSAVQDAPVNVAIGFER